MNGFVNLYAVGTPTLPKSFCDEHALAVFQLLEGLPNVTVPSHVATKLVAAFWIKQVKAMPPQSYVLVTLDGTRDEIAKRVSGGAQRLADWCATYREYQQRAANEPLFNATKGDEH